MKYTDIVKALEAWRESAIEGYEAHLARGGERDEREEGFIDLTWYALSLINRQKAEIEELREINQSRKEDIPFLIAVARAEAIKEFAERIDELFTRYAHWHKYAETARTDYIELASGEECEMQSVWDVITLNKNGLVEYGTMCRLQENIETIVKARLIAEIQKDLKCLVKEMVGERE